MIVVVGTLLLAALVTGFVLRGVLGLPSIVNYAGQLVVIGVVANTIGAAFVPTALAVAVLTAMHIAKVVAMLFLSWKGMRGDYGEEVRWMLELIDEQDNEFLQAQRVLPDREIREVKILSDTKQELRENMIERADEHRNN